MQRLKLNHVSKRGPRTKWPTFCRQCIFVNEKFHILIQISLKFVPKCPIDNIPALVQIMALTRLIRFIDIFAALGGDELNQSMVTKFTDANVLCLATKCQLTHCGLVMTEILVQVMVYCTMGLHCIDQVCKYFSRQSHLWSLEYKRFLWFIHFVSWYI